MSTGVFSTPRPVPGRLAPVLAGTAVIALALPVVLVAGWPVRGWLVAAVLWFVGQALAAALARLPLGLDNTAATGVRGVGQSFRAIAIGVPLVIVTVSDATVGLTAAVVYALAFTAELVVSLVAYYGGSAP